MGKYAPLNWSVSVSITPSKLRTGRRTLRSLRSFLRRRRRANRGAYVRCRGYGLSAYHILYSSYSSYCFVQLYPNSSPLIACITLPLQQRSHTNNPAPPSHSAKPHTDHPVRPRPNKVVRSLSPTWLASLGEGWASYIIPSPIGDLHNSCYHAMLPYDFVPLPTQNCTVLQYKQYKLYR
jgi:hypothetical protein